MDRICDAFILNEKMQSCVQDAACWKITRCNGLEFRVMALFSDRGKLAEEYQAGEDDCEGKE